MLTSPEQPAWTDLYPKPSWSSNLKKQKWLELNPIQTQDNLDTNDQKSELPNTKTTCNLQWPNPAPKPQNSLNPR